MKKQILSIALTLALLASAVMTAAAQENEYGRGREYILTFDKPRNMSQTIQPEGSFRGDGIAGSYIVTEREIIVTITEKPALVPISLIEEELKKLFEGIPATPPTAPMSAPLSSPIIITNFDVTYTYGKPDDLAEAIQDVSEYLEEQGGYLWGNEQRGEFIIGGRTEGIYRVTGDTVTVSFNAGPGIFIIKEEFSFHFDKPRNISEAVRKVSEEIRKNNGTLTGNNLEQQGSFSVKGVVGSYIVTNRVDVTITERPFYASKDRVEREVIEWFKGM